MYVNLLSFSRCFLLRTNINSRSLMEERGVHVFNDLDYLQVLKSNEQMEL